MRRSLSFGIIAIIALVSLVAAEAATGIARNFVDGLIYDRSDSRGADPCEDWPSVAEWEELNRELSLVENHVGGSIYTTLVLDEDSARAAGISDETLALLDELASFLHAGIKKLDEKNAMMEDEEARRLLDDRYPKLKAFFACAEYRRNPY